MDLSDSDFKLHCRMLRDQIGDSATRLSLQYPLDTLYPYINM